MSLSVVALVPAWNEEQTIGTTIESLLDQTRPIDRIVIIPNGCSDDTAAVARTYQESHPNIVVLELPRLKHRKSEALNRGWQRYAMFADIVLCVDADTTFDKTAVAEWVEEFTNFTHPKKRLRDLPLGGSTAKATVRLSSYLGKMQKAEYAKGIDESLLRGVTSVLAGAGAAFSGRALRQVVLETDREGPWSYLSDTEDYELTIQLRKRGWMVMTSPMIRMYTDGMPSVKALWGQRLKWCKGTYHELLNHGINRHTIHDWIMVWRTGGTILLRLLLIAVMGGFIALGAFQIHWFWWTVYPLTFVLYQLYMSGRMPNPDRKDRLYAISIAAYEFYGFLGTGWFVASWIQVLRERITRTRKDQWALQYRAEGIG